MYDGLEKIRSEYLQSGPLRGADRFCRVGSCEALRIVGLALSRAAAAILSIRMSNRRPIFDGRSFSITTALVDRKSKNQC